MKVCSWGHDEIVFDGNNCPFCEMITDKDEKIEALEDNIEELENQIEELKE